jgi:pimeloyl-ACP methyl ester carboxylesterase
MLLEVAGHPTHFMAEGSEMQVVDHAGHFLHLERPDVVNPRIIEFLAY